MNKIERIMVVTISIAILTMFNVAVAETNTVSEANDAPVLTGIGGPDQFGYRWVDSDQAWGPEYEWIDISEDGTRVTEMDDDTGNQYAVYGPYDIGFDFPFYGNTYNEIRFSPNGYLTFDDVDEGTYLNQHMMDDYTPRQYNNLIAVLWSFLYPYNAAYDEVEYDRPVYYYHDEENDRFIISFNHVSYHYSKYEAEDELPVSDLNFQVVLYADGRILMQYDIMDDTGCDEIDWDVWDDYRAICRYNNETVAIGIENAAGDDGLEVVFNEPYIHDSLAILFYPSAIYEYDIAPLSFITPTEPWQAPNSFTPTVTFENQGALAVSFDVNLTISYDGSIVYNETQSISELGTLISTDIDFPEYTPADSGIYTLTAIGFLDTDQNVLNDTLTMDFEVLSEYLPPAHLSGTNSQNGVAPLSWYEPGTPACSLMAYDDDIRNAGATLWGAYIFANEFNIIAPAEVCTVQVRVSSNSDVDVNAGFWPFPDAIHDSIKVYVFGDDGSGMPVDTLADLTVTANYYQGGWITCAFDPPLVVESNKFWVGYRNITEDYHYEAFILDYKIHHPEVQWYCDANGVWHHDVLKLADFKIRASVIANGIDVSNQGLDIIGYNIYRDTEPGVEIGEATLLEEGITENSYNDETNISNGTTYYYIVTAVYSDGENTIESVPSDEIAITPASGGELIADHTTIEVGPLSDGVIDTTQVVLTNNGDLDVSFSVSVSTENEQLGLARRVVDNRRVISPEESYFDRGASEVFAEQGGEDTPVVTGFATPDEFGYVWIDSDEDYGPEYSWIDPSEHTMLEDLTYDEDISSRLYFDFDFPFYGNTFNSLYVSRYGHISFTDRIGNAYEVDQLPSTWAPTNMVAPFWCFVGLSSETYIAFYSDSDMVVVSWVNCDLDYVDMESYGTSNTFQLILYKDGQIKFQYKKMYGDINCAAIGIQNANYDIGTQVAFVEPYAHDELAVLLKAPWLRVEPPVETVPAGGSITLDVISNSTGLEGITYGGNLSIVSGDVNGSLDNINIPVTMTMTDIEEGDNNLPLEYSLLQNYPNPFNATTSIKFSLEKTDKVTLNIYDIGGRLIRSLYDGELPAGSHNIVWNGTNSAGESVASGIYFYSINSSEGRLSNRMVLLK